ncbi:hypothetical protein AB0H77_14605 [Streptomyces sp. NPDC050844]|uniref:DUF7426 family protein n=1 Tax=Streptomyces sp. NPDC050844 TaxID=3155790 RepID=UPI0033E9E730
MATDGTPMDAEVLDDAAEMDLYRIALGDAYDDLFARLDWPRFKHVANDVGSVDHCGHRRRRAVLERGRRPFSTGPESGGTTGLIGCGEVDPATGLHEWYEHPAGYQPRPQGRQDLTWGALLDQWALIEADLHEVYGIDLGAPDLLRERSWRWLRLRILGLLSAESRLSRHFAPPEPKPRRTPRT